MCLLTTPFHAQLRDRGGPARRMSGMTIFLGNKHLGSQHLGMPPLRPICLCSSCELHNATHTAQERVRGRFRRFVCAKERRKEWCVRERPRVSRGAHLVKLSFFSQNDLPRIEVQQQGLEPQFICPPEGGSGMQCHPRG